MAGKQLGDEGSFWRVGNGNTISIWKDKWVRKPPSFKPTPPEREPTPQNVAALIDNNTGTWNNDIISDLFVSGDREYIKAIHLAKNPNEDKLIWQDRENGELIVKSTYWLDKKKDFNPNDARWKRDFLWNWIWNANVAPKVRIFCGELSTILSSCAIISLLEAFPLIIYVLFALVLEKILFMLCLIAD